MNPPEHDYTLEMLAKKWEKGEMAEKEVLLKALMWMQSLVTNQELTEKSLERLKWEVLEFKEEKE